VSHPSLLTTRSSGALQASFGIGVAGLVFLPVGNDLHPWNVLVGADQRLWMVDWDEAILAPKSGT
jgi:thiamine kinase-like enzyme